MKSIVREYGAVILAIIAALAVFAIVCGRRAAINVYEKMSDSNPIMKEKSDRYNPSNY